MSGLRLQLKKYVRFCADFSGRFLNLAKKFR